MDIEHVNRLTESIIGCGIEVHRALGSGLLESAYRECMAIELANSGLQFETEHPVTITYKGSAIGTRLRIDLLVEGTVVVELKAIDGLHPIHQSQVISYLKLSGYPAGLILNFNTGSLRNGIRRITHPDLYYGPNPFRLAEKRDSS
jgi:GxxExxY protein